MTGLTLLAVIVEKWSLMRLGLRLDNFNASLWPYLVFTILGFLAIFAYATLLKQPHAIDWHKTSFFLHVFLLMSVAQEFIYRTFLIPKLMTFTQNTALVMLIDSAIFLSPHLIYAELKKSLPLVFIGGLGFCWMYIHYPNLILISLSHAVLNATVIYFGFLFITNQEKIKYTHYKQL